MKKLLAASAIACIATVGISAPVAASPESASMNHETYWETSTTDCTKVEFADGVTSFSLPSQYGLTYTMLVLKAGSGDSANDVIGWPASDYDYYHQTGKGLSHAIYCTMEEPPS
ncbi:hypothetical protein ACX3O0_03345 [Homoserinimonas sp. A447]